MVECVAGTMSDRTARLLVVQVQNSDAVIAEAHRIYVCLTLDKSHSSIQVVRVTNKSS